MRARTGCSFIAGLLAGMCLATAGYAAQNYPGNPGARVPGDYPGPVPESADPGHSTPGYPDLMRSYPSALMSYLYIEPYEVRHEVLARVKALQPWLDLGLRGDRYIDADELAPLRERIADLLLNKNPLRVDDTELAPVLEYSSYLSAGPQGMEPVAQPERLEIAAATVGVILSYRTAGMPQQVSVDWELFGTQLQRVPVTTTDPSGPQMQYVTPDHSVYTWSNFLNNYRLPSVQQVPVPDRFNELQIPIGTLLCVLAMLPVGWQVYNRKRLGKRTLGRGVILVLLTSGAMFSWAYSPTFAVARPALMTAAMDNAQAVILLQGLLKNIYRALAFPQQRDAHEQLALTVSDKLLADIHRQHRQSFAVPEAGGSPARVRQLVVQSATARSVKGKPPAYVIHGQWSALASAGHWGYQYQRKISFDARLTVEAEGGNWKVTALELLDEPRVESVSAPAASALRKL